MSPLRSLLTRIKAPDAVAQLKRGFKSIFRKKRRTAEDSSPQASNDAQPSATGASDLPPTETSPAAAQSGAAPVLDQPKAQEPLTMDNVKSGDNASAEPPAPAAVQTSSSQPVSAAPPTSTDTTGLTSPPTGANATTSQPNPTPTDGTTDAKTTNAEPLPPGTADNAATDAKADTPAVSVATAPTALVNGTTEETAKTADIPSPAKDEDVSKAEKEEAANIDVALPSPSHPPMQATSGPLEDHPVF